MRAIRSVASLTWSSTRIFTLSLLARPPPRPCAPLYGLPRARRRRRFAERAGEELHRVDDFHGEPLGAALPRDLHQAARVAGRDHTRPALADLLDLAPREVPGQLRLEQVVDA